MTIAYYNENDPGAARWLQNLIEAGQIASGVVDTRPIQLVQPQDLEGFTQCHFFAGIGGWSLAARMAGWPDDRPLWSGSCPCQPFSAAGKGGGASDLRHLWPDFFRLIRSCRPDDVVGEQVAGAAGYGWLDGVAADLAGEGYASGAVDIPACAVDAPHIRSRLYWVASHVGDGLGPRLEGQRGYGDRWPGWSHTTGPVAASDGGNGSGPLADSNPSRQFQREGWSEGVQPLGGRRHMHSDGGDGSWWRGADWIICHDGKARRVADARAPLLAHGISGGVAVSRPDALATQKYPQERQVSRIAAWRGFGNAIVPALAAEVLGALLDTCPQ